MKDMPITVELHIKYPPTTGVYGGDPESNNVVLRDEVNGPTELVAKVREYEQLLREAWAVKPVVIELSGPPAITPGWRLELKANQ